MKKRDRNINFKVLLTLGTSWKKHLLPGIKKLIKLTFLTITKPFCWPLFQAGGIHAASPLSVRRIEGNTGRPAVQRNSCRRRRSLLGNRWLPGLGNQTTLGWSPCCLHYCTSVHLSFIENGSVSTCADNFLIILFQVML